MTASQADEPLTTLAFVNFDKETKSKMDPNYVARRALARATLKSTPVYRRGNPRPIGTVADFVHFEPALVNLSQCEHGDDRSRCYPCLYREAKRKAVS
jgi:hypothetical protein